MSEGTSNNPSREIPQRRDLHGIMQEKNWTDVTISRRKLIGGAAASIGAAVLGRTLAKKTESSGTPLAEKELTENIAPVFVRPEDAITKLKNADFSNLISEKDKLLRRDSPGIYEHTDKPEELILAEFNNQNEVRFRMGPSVEWGNNMLELPTQKVQELFPENQTLLLRVEGSRYTPTEYQGEPFGDVQMPDGSFKGIWYKVGRAQETNGKLEIIAVKPKDLGIIDGSNPFKDNDIYVSRQQFEPVTVSS